MIRTEPPLKHTDFVWHGEWWGSPYLLMQSKRPKLEYYPRARETERVAAEVAGVTAALPGEPLQLGKPRWDPSDRLYCERPITGSADLAVDTDFLDFAGAETRPDEWRLVLPEGRTMHRIVGLRGGAPVAILAPRRYER